MHVCVCVYMYMYMCMCVDVGIYLKVYSIKSVSYQLYYINWNYFNYIGNVNKKYFISSLEFWSKNVTGILNKNIIVVKKKKKKKKKKGIGLLAFSGFYIIWLSNLLTFDLINLTW